MLSSPPSTLQAILGLLVILVFDIWIVGNLLWRINKMISRAAHFKEAVWGTQGTLEGMSGTNNTKDWPFLKRGSRPFSSALMLASTPVGCRRPGKWSALCEELPIAPTASLSYIPSRPALTATGPGGTRAVPTAQSTSFYSFLCFPISHRLTPPQPPCVASRARTLTITFIK